jgi:hypothetical protein
VINYSVAGDPCAPELRSKFRPFQIPAAFADAAFVDKYIRREARITGRGLKLG